MSIGSMSSNILLIFRQAIVHRVSHIRGYFVWEVKIQEKVHSEHPTRCEQSAKRINSVDASMEFTGR